MMMKRHQLTREIGNCMEKSFDYMEGKGDKLPQKDGE
jgi:hypothetical protein